MKGCGSTAHYFTDNRNLDENRKVHTFRFSGHVFSFTTDNGVFSKTGVDYGTEVLLECCKDIHGEVLDLGCGYGVVGIVLKTLYDCTVTAVDINPRAVELTQLNSSLNHAEVTAVVSDGFENLAGRRFSFVITNPPIRAGKQTIYGMFDDALAHLETGGVLLAVIRRKQGAESALRRLTETFGNCETIGKDKGYWVLKCVKQ